MKTPVLLMPSSLSPPALNVQPFPLNWILPKQHFNMLRYLPNENKTKMPRLATIQLSSPAHSQICGKSCMYLLAPFSYFPPAPQLLSLAFASLVFKNAQQPTSVH